MKSQVIKRSLVVHGHKTSISVENSFWQGLKEIAAQDQKTLSALVGAIDRNRGSGSNLSSAVRVYVLTHFRTLSAALVRSGREPVMAVAERAVEVRSVP